MLRLALLVSLIVSLSPNCRAAPGEELRRGGFLGVQVERFQQPSGEPAIIVRGLAEGGSSKDAGILPGDVIIRLQGRQVGSVPDFVAAARDLRAGDTAVLDIVRHGQPTKVDVKVKPRPVEKAPGLEVAYGALRVDGHLRRTLMTAPAAAVAKERRPAVLFVAGVGCFSQEIVTPGDAVGQLLYGLTRAGFITLRVEKSGAGDSQGPGCNDPQVDMEAEVRGYVAGLRALKQDPRVDPGKVFIVGLSIGGIEAPLIERQETVAGVVAINTAGKPFFEYLLETRRRQMMLRGMPMDEVDRGMAIGVKCNYAVLIDRQSPQEVVKRMPECREEVQFPAPHTFMQQWAALNMAEAWKKVDAPVLVIIGKSDYVATVSESPYLVDMLNGFRPGRATLKVIDGMDHGMSKAPSMRASMERSGPGEFEPAVLEAASDWLRRQAAAG